MPAEELSEFEKQRLANIAERDQLLKKLKQEAQSSGLALPPPPRPTAKKPPTDSSRSKRKPAPGKPVIQDDPAPRRVSSRLRGIAADSEVAKRKADEQQEAMMEAERARKVRKSDTFSFNEMVVSGQKLSLGGEGLIGVDVVTKGVAKPYERTFGDEDIQMTTDKDLKALREEMSGLQLWEAWEPNRMFLVLVSWCRQLMMCRYQVDPRENLHNDLPPLRNETVDLRGRQNGPPGRSGRIPRKTSLRQKRGRGRRRRRPRSYPDNPQTTHSHHQLHDHPPCETNPPLHGKLRQLHSGNGPGKDHLR